MCFVTEVQCHFLFHWYVQSKGSMLFRSLYESDNAYNDFIDPLSCSLIEQRTKNKEQRKIIFVH